MGFLLGCAGYIGVSRAAFPTGDSRFPTGDRRSYSSESAGFLIDDSKSLRGMSVSVSHT